MPKIVNEKRFNKTIRFTSKLNLAIKENANKFKMTETEIIEKGVEKYLQYLEEKEDILKNKIKYKKQTKLMNAYVDGYLQTEDGSEDFVFDCKIYDYGFYTDDFLFIELFFLVDEEYRTLEFEVGYVDKLRINNKLLIINGEKLIND